MNIPEIQKQLCEQLCRSVRLRQRDNGFVVVDNPFVFPDGDSISLYFFSLPGGKYKLSDLGNVAMRLSYDDDIRKYFDASKPQGRRMYQILRETNVREDNGEFYVETTLDSLAIDVLKFSQTLTQIYDLSMLNRPRGQVSRESEEKLKEEVYGLLPLSRISVNHRFACDADGHYRTDYYLRAPNGDKSNVGLYGVWNAGKAERTTITLHYLQSKGERHRPFLFLPDISSIPSRVRKCLSDAGGEDALHINEWSDIAPAVNQHWRRRMLI